MKDEFLLQIPAKQSMVLVARMALAGFMAQCGADVDTLEDVRTACDEACYYLIHQPRPARQIAVHAEYDGEWARIPHFYTSFYVYKYATGIISAISIAERIYKEGKPAVDDYFKFLSSGGSDSPVNLLKLAGVDLTKKDAFKAAMDSFRSTLDEFENL